MFQSDLLKDKSILITGGGTGLGKSMGRRVLELGAQLTICGRREGVLEATKAEFESDFPGRTRAIPCDLRDPAQVEALVAAIWQEAPLDALVNNAAGNFLARSETLSPRALELKRQLVKKTSGATAEPANRRAPSMGRTLIQRTAVGPSNRF